MMLCYSPQRLCPGSWHTLDRGKLCEAKRSGDCHLALTLAEGGESSRVCQREEEVLRSGKAETSFLCWLSTFCEELASSCVL